MVTSSDDTLVKVNSNSLLKTGLVLNSCINICINIQIHDTIFSIFYIHLFICFYAGLL